MAAVDHRPGAFVLEVADLGKDVLSAFTHFLLSRKVVDHRLETLLATISITTSLLFALGSTLNKYDEDYHVEDKIFLPVCETCKGDFEELIAMSKIAKEKGGWITESRTGGHPITTEVDPWFVFHVTLGQGEKANEFWARLNQTRQTLDALNDSIRFKTYKILEQENRLDPKQAEDLKHLSTLIPLMVRTLEKTEKDKKEKLALEEKRQRLKEAPKTVKSSRKRPDVGEKDDFAEFIKAAETDALSEDTIIDIDINEVRGKKNKKQVRFEDDDRSSVSSFEAHTRHFHEETKVVFEEWLLSHHNPRSTVRRSWGLMGLKIKECEEEAEYWDIEAKLRSQGELQSAYKNATSSTTASKYQASLDKAVKALPEHARDLIDWLIQDRHEATNNEKFVRQWSVVAVRPKEKHAYRAGRKLVKSTKDSDWLIMIKGETVGKVERKRPHRYDDPWRKPAPRRSHPRLYDRYEREYVRPRPHYEEYDLYPRRPPVRFVPYEDEEEEEDRLDNTFLSGTVAVGMFSSQEDAESRMDKVLDDMAGKVTA